MKLMHIYIRKSGDLTAVCYLCHGSKGGSISVTTVTKHVCLYFGWALINIHEYANELDQGTPRAVKRHPLLSFTNASMGNNAKCVDDTLSLPMPSFTRCVDRPIHPQTWYSQRASYQSRAETKA